MAYLNPQDRFQVQMRSMGEYIGKDNLVRFIDAFVEHLELAKLGFVQHEPPFAPSRVSEEVASQHGGAACATIFCFGYLTLFCLQYIFTLCCL